MDELKEILKKDRKINESSLNAYVSLLCKMKDKETDYNFLNDYEKMETILKKNKITTQKNKLTAIIVYLKSIKADDKIINLYSDRLKVLNTEYMNELKKQQKTETQKKNWIEYDDIIKLVDLLMLRVKTEITKSKQKLTNREFDMLQQAIILKTYINFPLRNDFANMKIIKKKDEQDMNNNYLVIDGSNMAFHINNYKNRSRLGSRVYDIPLNLRRLITLWLRFNNSGYYLIKSDRVSPMNPNNITKYLNKIFEKEYNKKISSSMIRHILISHINKDKPTILQKEEEEKAIENKFLHSELLNDLYRKI